MYLHRGHSEAFPFFLLLSSFYSTLSETFGQVP
jgi:hypothetical protein